MPYTINRSDSINNSPYTVDDATTNTQTSLTFVGKNYTGYSKPISENFLHLLENFASATEPENPIQGQLWYDTASSALKVCRLDGPSNWRYAGGVTSSSSQPALAVVGDLWANTDTQQLYLYNGSTWVLVGPQFSQSTKSGPLVETILDSSSVPVEHTIISFYATDKIIAIFSTDEFTPKITISGFTILKPGINLSTADFTGNGSVNKIWATASAADALVVGSTTVSSSNFLRSDQASTTGYGLNVRNNSGITLGSDLTTSITTTGAGETILYNKNEGSSIFIRTIYNGDVNSSITVFGNKIGINKSNPAVALDVNGATNISGVVSLANTTASINTTTGALVVAGGVAIGENLRIAKNAYVNGTLTLNTLSSGGTPVAGPAMLPSVDNIYDLGSTAKKWNTVYTSDVIATGIISAGTFQGNFSGNISGTASRLANPTAFKLQGDVSSNTVSFNGQQVNQQAYFTVTINSDFINGKESAISAEPIDELIFNKLGADGGLRKINKSTFFSNVATVPAGTILPFAGTKIPAGYLLCDGSEIQIGNYSELFDVIGYTYKPLGLLVGVSTFALPDFRGRFGLGADNMQNPGATTYDKDGQTVSAYANRVADASAYAVGLGNGAESKTLGIRNLPEHKHDMRGTARNGTKGQQFFAIRDTSEPITDADAQAYTTNGPSAVGRGQFLPNSGGIQAPIGTSFGVPISIMNPYLTINYIIYTGRIA